MSGRKRASERNVQRRAHRPGPPTRAEFAEAAEAMNMLAVPWIDAVDVANAALPVDAGSTQR